MSLRLRRLHADYQKICSIFSGKTRIRMIKTIGNPPEKYQFEYLVNGLEIDPSSKDIRMRSSFNVEIVLTSAYPRLSPQCKMLSPVFHPNIAPHAICIGDHWSAGESLANLIVRIAEMIAYQSYNVKSPLNGEAARWVEQNQDQVPTDHHDFSKMLDIGEAGGRIEDGCLCANCGRKNDGGVPFSVCLNDHIACGDCRRDCVVCDTDLCLKCDDLKCIECQRSVCYKCIHKCIGCRQLVCTDHTRSCKACGMGYCRDCTVNCDRCQAVVCINDIKKVADADGSRAYCCPDCSQLQFAPQPTEPDPFAPH